MSYRAFLDSKIVFVLCVVTLVIFRLITHLYAPFGYDQYLIYDKVAELFNTRIIPPFSIYVPVTRDAYIPGPGISVIYFLFYSISRHPSFVSLATQILQLLGIGLLYLWMSQLFSKRNAKIVLLAMLLSPWLSYYAALIWNPGLIFAFSALSFYSLWKLHGSNKVGYWLLLCFGICMAIQVHMSSLLLILIALIFISYYRIRPSVTSVLLSVLLFTVLFYPYIQYEINHNASNTLALIRRTTGFDFQFDSILRAIHFSVIFVSSEVAHFAGAGLKKLSVFFGYNILASVILIPLSLITAYLSYVIFIKFLRSKLKLSTFAKEPATFLFTLAFILSPLIYIFTARNFSPHNLLVIAPVLWLPVAWFIENPSRLYFPFMNTKRLFAIYAVSSVLATYMILISNPNQVPAKDLLPTVEFIGRPSHTPVLLSGYEDLTTRIEPIESIHRNYWRRDNRLLLRRGERPRTSFLVFDKRRVSKDLIPVFEYGVCAVLKE